jgi:hypothetical protein
MNQIKTRYLLKRAKLAGVDYRIHIGILCVVGPLLFILPMYGTWFLTAWGIAAFILRFYLKGKNENFLQDRMGYFLYDQGVWMKHKDKMLNKRLK